MPQIPNKKPAPAKPVHEIRVGGIRASIWKNETDKGPRFNTTFDRSYRDGEEWKTSDSFGRDDLLTLGFVAQEALRWIVEQRQQSQPGMA
jgi:hypothetical protein